MTARSLAAALLAISTLAGCGATALPAAAPKGLGRLAAKADARRVELRVPAKLLKYAEEAVEAERTAVKDEWEKDMYGRPMYPRYRIEWAGAGSRDALKVVVSRDGFKTQLQESTMYDGRRTGGDLVVPYFTAPGEVTYYLEVQATKVEVATGKATKLPVRFVSDHGKNFRGELR